ncbi:hypothetical protein GALMADRAFT_232656 [Galerina marginata CBS 339.88]|uniref:Uncharacterized protein n=1 Tax=Galerina marginata (strain CBS 339.88) TaxID=685588 RepID=A0A067S640_GALM3|nr:hypothetical protein GALMADRAFT_232656 [Galerina marginata CBS 339.88]
MEGVLSVYIGKPRRFIMRQNWGNEIKYLVVICSILLLVVQNPSPAQENHPSPDEKFKPNLKHTCPLSHES